MKILVTGATGFIGSHLRKSLSQKYTLVALVRPSTPITELETDGIEPLVFDGDVIKLSEQLTIAKIVGIVHLASLYLKTHNSADINSLVESNVLFPTQLLEAASGSSVQWFINTGTFWQHYQDSEYAPVNLYASTKEAFIDIAKYYQETSQLTFVTLKLSDTFGPGDTRPKVFNLWHKHSLSGEVLKMSAGEQQMDISYIDDVVSAYEILIELLQQNKAKLKNEYAVTSDTHNTLKQLAKIFEASTGKKIPIDWGVLPYREREVMKTWSKGQRVPGWVPTVSIAEGIKKTFKDTNE
jgi:nucleoside-diphosphate-sugar epimerase